MTWRVCFRWFPSLSPWDYSPVHHSGKQASQLAAVSCLLSITRFTPSLPYLHCCCCCCLVTQSCLTPATPRTAARQVPLSMGFPRQEYQDGSPFISPGTFPAQGSNPCFLLGRWILWPRGHRGGPSHYWYTKDLHLNSCLREPRVIQLSLYFMPTESLLQMAFYTKIWYIVFIKQELPDLQSLGGWEQWCVEARA